MRSPSSVGSRSVHMNMTPMIDVVFLLIIFFLVSSHLARQETQLELDLPTAATGEVADAAATRVTVNILPGGAVLRGGEPTPAEGLAPRLAYEQSRAADGLRVQVRVDRVAPYAAVAPVLVACAEAGVWDVSFAVRSEAGAATE